MVNGKSVLIEVNEKQELSFWLIDIGCAEVRITPWMVCSRATQEQLPGGVNY